jgi:hypothetical protein
VPVAELGEEGGHRQRRPPFLRLAQIIHAGGGLAWDGGWAAEQFVILRLGYDGGGPAAGGSTGPGVSPSVSQG